MVSSKTTNILIDSSPDFRQQALANNITRLDAVLYTHAHSDHISGIDDLKMITILNKKIIPAFTDAETAEKLLASYRYIFEQGYNEIYKPFMQMNIINPYQKLQLGDITVQSFAQLHGQVPSLGFRIGNLVYSTDVNYLPSESHAYLADVDIWILDFLRYHWSPSHGYIDSLLDFIAKFKPKKVILTHMAHEVDYIECQRILPKIVVPGYDSMKIKVQIRSI
jgi:phosphoribosyl 1,2-cyclic phosphate phosphodiesterase